MEDYLKKLLKYPEQKFTKEMINDTLKYQKDYGFKIGENDLAWNNEADAFRHAYMQAILSTRFSNFAAKMAGDAHENQGRKRGQDQREANMDLWNNEQGRQIADEIGKEYPLFRLFPTELKKEIIAQKVVERMQQGCLITDINDKRQYEEKPNFLNYINSLTGNNRIYTREDVSGMSNDEFYAKDSEIMAQLEAFKGTMPTNYELAQETLRGGVIYVKPYIRSDGTKVKGYYRSRQSGEYFA